MRRHVPDEHGSDRREMPRSARAAGPPVRTEPGTIVSLQHLAGNRSVGALLGGEHLSRPGPGMVVQRIFANTQLLGIDTSVPDTFDAGRDITTGRDIDEGLSALDQTAIKDAVVGLLHHVATRIPIDDPAILATLGVWIPDFLRSRVASRETRGSLNDAADQVEMGQNALRTLADRAGMLLEANATVAELIGTASRIAVELRQAPPSTGEYISGSPAAAGEAMAGQLEGYVVPMLQNVMAGLVADEPDVEALAGWLAPLASHVASLDASAPLRGQLETLSRRLRILHSRVAALALDEDGVKTLAISHLVTAIGMLSALAARPVEQPDELTTGGTSMPIPPPQLG